MYLFTFHHCVCIYNILSSSIRSEMWPLKGNLASFACEWPHASGQRRSAPSSGSEREIQTRGHHGNGHVSSSICERQATRVKIWETVRGRGVRCNRPRWRGFNTQPRIERRGLAADRIPAGLSGEWVTALTGREINRELRLRHQCHSTHSMSSRLLFNESVFAARLQL